MRLRSFDRLWEKIIEFGILFLVIYTPLAFGGVSSYSRFLLQTVTASLLLLWLLWLFLHRKYEGRGGERETGRKGEGETGRRGKREKGRRGERETGRYYLQFAFMPGAAAVCGFFGLVVLQLVPLPVAFIRYLSPQSYQLYRDAAAHTASAIPAFLPLSVCTQATETELLTFLVYPAIFFLIANIVHTPRQIHRLIYTILILGFLESFYSLLQLFPGKFFFFLHGKSVRIHGSFVNENHLAGYLEMVILLALGVLFIHFETASSLSRKKGHLAAHEKYAKTILLLAMIFIMILAHLLSGSRGGFISLAGGLLFFTLLAYNRRLLRRWLVVGLILIPVILIMALLIAPEHLISSLTNFTGKPWDTSFQLRWEIWRTQWHIFQDFPIVGSGFGTFSHLARRYQTFRWHFRLVHSESDVMQVLAEMGIVGTVMVLWIGFAYFSRILSAWQQRHSRWAIAIVAGGLSAIVSIVIHSGVDFNLHIPSNALVFTVIAALVYVTVYTRPHRYYGKK